MYIDHISISVGASLLEAFINESNDRNAVVSCDNIKHPIKAMILRHLNKNANNLENSLYIYIFAGSDFHAPQLLHTTEAGFQHEFAP
jgi:hypothetical protein